MSDQRTSFSYKIQYFIEMATKTNAWQLLINILILSMFSKVVTAEGAPVSQTDLRFDHGYIHVIDKVIYPLPLANIPNTAAANSDFSTLVSFVQQAGLLDDLAGESLCICSSTISYCSCKSRIIAGHLQRATDICLAQL